VTEVVTGEAVVLDVPVARFPSRIGALLIDLLIQVAILGVALIAIFLSAGDLDAATVAAITLSCYVAVVVGYSTAFETLTRGKTPGKMAFGLRVVSDDGGPVRFRQALVRALTGAIEVWTLVGAPIGLITSLISAKGKRLGDMFAGTYVIQERVPRRTPLPPWLAQVPGPLLGWAQVAEISGLSDQNAEAAGSYLRRFNELSPQARTDLGVRIASAVAAQVSPPPPPGTPPDAYLAAVLAIRRQRESARFGAVPGPSWGAPPPPGAAAGQPTWPGPGAAPGQPTWPGPGTGGAPGQPAWPGSAPAPGQAPATTGQSSWTAPGSSAAPAGAPAAAPPGPVPPGPAPAMPGDSEQDSGPASSAGFAPPG
jgi:uncharacterized RDD family membrane protein YckC